MTLQALGSELGHAATFGANGWDFVRWLSYVQYLMGSGAGGVVAIRCVLFWRVGSAS